MRTPCIVCGVLVPTGTGGRCPRHVNPARRIRSSTAWRDLARTVAAVGRCAVCGKVGPVEAGHIVAASRRPDLALDPRNVQPVCRACNPRGPRQ